MNVADGRRPRVGVEVTAEKPAVSAGGHDRRADDAARFVLETEKLMAVYLVLAFAVRLDRDIATCGGHVLLQCDSHFRKIGAYDTRCMRNLVAEVLDRLAAANVIYFCHVRVADTCDMISAIRLVSMKNLAAYMSISIIGSMGL